MAALQVTNNIIHLRPLHIFGRNPSKSDTLLHCTKTSQIHASIAWNGVHWDITSFGQNGTYIDNLKLTPNLKTTLGIGQKIQFSLADDIFWEVLDLAPPSPFLISQKNEIIILESFHLLPNEADAAASVYLSESGTWIFDNGFSIQELKNGDNISLQDNTWTCLLPCFIEATETYKVNKSNSCKATFKFDLSPNEEHAYLRIEISEKLFDLDERKHHYSLITLARRRFEDFQRGLDTYSQGWVAMEELCKMLGLDETHINTQLFRAKSQIVKECQGLADLSDVIERRRGEIRFGLHAFQIKRGAEIEAEFTPPNVTTKSHSFA